MIKVITLITKFIVIALSALLFASCNYSIDLKSIRGSGNVTTEKRTVNGDFKSVEVSNGIDLVIEQSNKTEIIVEADDNLQKGITTKVENGVLIVSSKYHNFLNVKSRKVTVKMPIIEGLQASSGSSIKSIGKIKGENISLDASSAAEINLDIESDFISSETSSGSSISIHGKALKLETNASSGSEIDAKDLLANEVVSDVSSGGEITVHPILSLDAEASSGGDIKYNTTPKSIQKRSSSGGSVSKE